MKKLHRMAAVFAAALLLFVWMPDVQAARTGTVTTDGARVRDSAGSSGAIVCSLSLNTTVDVTGEEQDGSGSTWYSVTFTYNGSEQSGYIRSDLLSVSGEETSEEGEEETAGSASAGGYTIGEPPESYSGQASLTQTTVSVNGSSYTAYTSDSQLFLVWAQTPSGSSGWYWYDPSEETFQRDAGQFSGGSSEPEGLINALQDELTELKESSSESLSTRLYIIIALAILAVILLVVVIVLAVRLHGVEYEYYDEDEDEDGEEDEENSDFDSFVEAARSKQLNEDIPGASRHEPVPEETEDLPEIDMSEVLKVEKEAVQQSEATREEAEAEPAEVKAAEVRPAEAEPAEAKPEAAKISEAKTAPEEKPVSAPANKADSDEDEDEEDFDIEILDLDDLGL